MATFKEALEAIRGTFQKGTNPLVEHILGEGLNFLTFDWKRFLITWFLERAVREIFIYRKFHEEQSKLWKPIKEFWSSFLPSELLEKHQIDCGQARERERNLFDLAGVVHASSFPTQSYFDWRKEYLDPLEKQLRIPELTLGKLAELDKVLQLKVSPTLSGKIPYRIETGGWIPNDNSLSLLVREDSKRPTYRFRIKGREDKEVTEEQIKKIRESISQTRKATLNGQPVEWIIYDSKAKETILEPRRFDDKLLPGESAFPFKEVGAIVIYANHPTEYQEILAFIGDRAPASAISPLALTRTTPFSESPFKKISMLKEEIKERIGKARYFEMVLKFTFERYRWGDPPTEETLKDVEIVKPGPRPLI